MNNSQLTYSYNSFAEELEEEEEEEEEFEVFFKKESLKENLMKKN